MSRTIFPGMAQAVMPPFTQKTTYSRLQKKSGYPMVDGDGLGLWFVVVCSPYIGLSSKNFNAILGYLSISREAGMFFSGQQRGCDEGVNQ